MSWPAARGLDVVTDLDWRRPHPITLVMEIGLALRSMMIAGVAIWGGLVGSGAGGGLAESMLELLVIVGPMGAALGRWYTTRYALDTESLHHHYGLIWRRKQVLPRANVQNVSTKAGILARLGSVVQLQISDASSSGDVTIRFVSQEEADRLTALLRSGDTPAGGAAGPWPGLAGGESVGASDTGAIEPAPEVSAAGTTGPAQLGVATAPQGPAGRPADRAPLVSPPLSLLLRAEATSIPVLALAATALIVGAAGPLVLWLAGLPAGVSPVAGWLAVIGITAAPLVVMVSQVVSRLVLVGSYRLTAEPDRLRIKVGLLTEARVAARRERIQQIRVRRDLPHRQIGLERIEFETADVEIDGSAATSYLSPVSRAGEWRRLASEVFGEVQLDESDLLPVSPLTKRRMLVRFAVGSVPWLALAVVHPALPLPLVAATMAAGWWYSRRRYSILGWAVSDDQLLVRAGVVLGRLTLVRLDKVQTLRLSSTIFQRRLDLVTLRLSTAGHGFQGLVALPDLPRSAGEELLERLARRAAATPVSETL